MERELLVNTKNKLKKAADILYKNDVNAGMAEMNQVLPDIALISTWITDDEMQKRLINDALTPALDAMQKKDATMLADIISYELIEILDTLV